jgi:hypothetical protein
MSRFIEARGVATRELAKRQEKVESSRRAQSGRGPYSREQLEVVIHAGRIVKDRRCCSAPRISHGRLPSIAVSALGYSDREKSPSSAHEAKPILCQLDIKKSARSTRKERPPAKDDSDLACSHTRRASNRYPEDWDDCRGPLIAAHIRGAKARVVIIYLSRILTLATSSSKTPATLISSKRRVLICIAATYLSIRCESAWPSHLSVRRYTCTRSERMRSNRHTLRIKALRSQSRRRPAWARRAAKRQSHDFFHVPHSRNA